MNTEGLNDAQAAAVAHRDGPLLVVAGAGTGKTRVIIERIQRLISDGVDPSHILALTFTEKAAGEMLDRIGENSLSNSLDVTIATYNGFGQSLLDSYGSEWGLTNLRLLGDIGELVFLREHFDSFTLDYFAPLSNPTGQLKTLAKYVSLCKQELVLPEVYANYAAAMPTNDAADKVERQKHQEIASFYTEYQALCRAHNVITYDDQIFLTIQLLQARPNILRTIQDRYQYILVDEFQDTNTMQSRLIDLLAGERQNLMVVGDDDQAIYGWRGATLANILDFKNRYPTAKDITLIENYRSTQHILDASYRLIRQNDPNRLEVLNHLDKKLRAQTSDGPMPVAQHFFIRDQELAWVASDIANRLQHDPEAGSNIAVLARGNPMVQRVHEALELHNVPHAVVGLHSDLYKQPAVTQLLEALKTVNDPLDSTALFHTLGGPVFALPQQTLGEIAASAKRNHQSLASAIEESENDDFKAALTQLSTWREQHANITVGELAYNIITDSNWKMRLYEHADHESDAVLQGQALSEFFKTLKEFERIASVASVRSYLDNLPTLQAAGSAFDDSADISDSVVNVMTVHKSKGLEWNTVYVVDCKEQSFPVTGGGDTISIPEALIKNQSTADSRIAEERRAMYVAATRARRELILTYSDKISAGGTRNSKVSRFVTEMLDRTNDQPGDPTEQSNLELFAPRDLPKHVHIPSSILRDGTYLLTASQIDEYIGCPLNFYYKYILSVPEAESARASYGTAIHAAIQRINERRLRGSSAPSHNEILELVRAKMPKSGYDSARTRERLHAHVETITRTIYDRFTTEEPPIEAEQSFDVAVPDLPVRLHGRMDAVYQHANGVEIYDYKTSTSVTTPEKAKSRASSSVQLTVYAYVWQLMHGELPASLVLDFVETGQKGSIRRTQQSIETLRKNIGKMVQSMQAGEYPPGHDHTYCSHPE